MGRKEVFGQELVLFSMFLGLSVSALPCSSGCLLDLGNAPWTLGCGEEVLLLLGAGDDAGVPG